MCLICGSKLNHTGKFCSRECYYNGQRAGLVKLGFLNWSKGLTKETDPRVKKMSESLIGNKAWNFAINKEDPRYLNWKNSTISSLKSEKHRDKVSEKVKLDWEKSPERRKTYGLMVKKLALWKNPDFVLKWHQSRKRRPNKKELFLLSILESNFENIWKFTGDGAFVIGSKNPDYICIIPGAKKVIELYGTYWHSRDTGEEKVNYYKSFNYDCLIVWEDELKDLQKLIDRINDYMNNKFVNVYRQVNVSVREEKLCSVCGVKFIGIRKTCNKICRYKLFYRSNTKIRVIVKCIICGEEIKCREKNIKKYCSVICRNIGYKSIGFRNHYDSKKNLEVELKRRQAISDSWKHRKTLDFSF